MVFHQVPEQMGLELNDASNQVKKTQQQTQLAIGNVGARIS